ncbi:MmcQ/YjbR family DNA-binding protein [Ilyomonas limi]|uniref:MmcQ/YjbR family DNA-binding protein n=1 Tax=Ilyomonas limi TaxID=2575867 RepID=A0A4V6XAU5_9BACT|nr:MmcQ/YjbR family DNA-binding protein [Ilyomonas limi]TKK67453.1 MmcQ/YjbR family DNA-binding protein [Ilyomonas limi]
MISPEEVKKCALSFEGTDEKPHFHRIAFTVNKRIFATLSYEDKTVNLMFNPQLQVLFCPPSSEVIFPIPNGWGKKGATTINLDKATKKLVQSALQEAYKLKKKNK